MLHRVALAGAHDGVGELFAHFIKVGVAGIRARYGHGGADVHAVGGHVRVIHHDGGGDGHGQFLDLGFQLGLLVLGGVVFGVFTQVTVTAGDGDLLRHLGTAHVFQIVQLLLQLFHSLRGYDDALALFDCFTHGIIPP